MKRILLSVAALAGAAAFFAFSNAPIAEAAQAQGDVARGKAAFERIGCWACHGHQGQGGSTGPKIAPNPLAFPAFSGFVRTTSGEMPPFTARVLPDQDLRDIHAFLMSVPAAPAVATIPLLQ